MKTKVFLCVMALVSMVGTGFSAEVNKWHGIILNQTTVEEATEILGKPDKKSFAGLGPTLHDKFLIPERKKKIWIGLMYKRRADMKKIELWADKGNKIVMIHLQPEKKIEASMLPEIYKSKIVPWFTGLEVGMFPKNYEEHEGNVYAKTYPAVYKLLSENDQAYMEAGVDNASLGMALKEVTGVRDTGLGYPGKVLDIYLISKALKVKTKVLE